MRPTQIAAIALIAGAIIHAARGIVGQIVQASTLVSDDLFSYAWTRTSSVKVPETHKTPPVVVKCRTGVSSTCLHHHSHSPP